MGSLLFFLSSLTPSHAFAPAEDVHIGTEPERVRRYHRELQHQLRTDKNWSSFTEGEGAGWLARFDEKTGTAYRAWGPGIDLGALDDAAQVEDALRQLFARYPTLVQVDGDELILRDANFVERTDTWYVHFDRVVDGIPVWRGGIEARIKFGKLILLGIETHPELELLSTSPELAWQTAVTEAVELGPVNDIPHEFSDAELVILPLENEQNRLDYRLAWEVRTTTEEVPGIWVSHVDAHTGELLNVYNEIRFLDGTITAWHDLRTVDGNYTESAVPLAHVTNSSGDEVETDWGGGFDLDGSRFTTDFNGKWLRVLNQDGDEAEASFTDGDFMWTDNAATQAEIDTYIFLHQVRDWGLTYAPEIDIVTSTLRSYVNLSSTCNAYYDGNVNFYQKGGGCNNTARIADVNYHEWGHGFHYTSLQSGSYDGSMGEGIGDTVAFHLTDDYIIAPYFSTGGSGIRDVEEDRVYPDDVVDQVHTDGLIYGGSAWDLLKALRDEYGDEYAFDVSAQLLADAVKGGPTLTSVYDEYAVADDDDGDLSNGTPHACEILEAFAAHGLGPDGNAGVIAMDHLTLDNFDTDEVEYPVVAELTNMATECVDFELADATLYYSTDLGDSWEALPMGLSGMDVEAAIPMQAPGTIVTYYVEAQGSDGTTISSPAGADINPHTFLVGDAEVVYFEDFEDDDGYSNELLDGQETEGANDWQRGTPQGKAGDPDFAWSGDRVWGNDLGWDNYNGASWNGEYQAEKHNRLSSVEIDVGGYSNLVLQFRRWLSVEDAYYDQAQVLVDGEIVWTNHESSQSIGDEHHEEAQWQLATIPIEDVDGDGFVTISWDIVSDGGLEFGGWNIDDVAIYDVDPTPAENGPGDEEGGDDTGPLGENAVDDGAGGIGAAGCACSSTSGGGGGLFALALGALALVRRRQ